MKTFAYYIRVFVITAIMFAIPILTTLSFFLNWDYILKCLLIVTTAVDFTLVMLVILWCNEDFKDV